MAIFEITDSFEYDLSPDDILSRFGLEKHGRVQQAIDKAVIDYMMPYWAFDSGTLARDAYTRSDIGSGLITYAPPGKDGISYAHYMYYGEIYGPNYPAARDGVGKNANVIAWWSPPGQRKHPTGRFMEYKKDVNPQAGWFPFQRMMIEHREDILEEARRVARDQ